uniref:Formamidopyrimidine-DNA glycosylase catalytic domain-containing protein n=1 Tax=Physcomitrium patens TaxID=3218 RepID=A0A7I4EJ83_PHYPA
MPELPEVEAAKRLLDSHCLGATIVKAVVDNDTKVIDGVTPAALQESLTGKKILSTHRKGKHLWLKLDSPPWPSFQFGMSGAVIIKGVKGPQYRSSKVGDEEEAFPTTYSKVHLVLSTGVELAFTDKRRFARVRLLEDPSKVPPISELGFDAYLELPSAEQLIEAMKTKKGSVKALLLDQSFIAGIGNWVGDEVLYHAKIHPEQSASSLKEEEVTRLHASVREVLEKAISVDADSEQFPRSWLYHHRWDKKPGMIDGNQIETISISGRSSAFVANVQKYTGPELKGARTRQAVEEEIPHDDSVAEPIAGGGNVEEAADATEEEATEEKVGVTETPKRGRGRPPKNKNDSPQSLSLKLQKRWRLRRRVRRRKVVPHQSAEVVLPRPKLNLKLRMAQETPKPPLLRRRRRREVVHPKRSLLADKFHF